MEKDNGKIIAVVALVVAVVALSVGFAAFADTLTIDGTATVKEGANTFEPNFGYAETPAAACTYTGGGAIEGTYNAGTASGNTWSGISVPLTAEHSSVTCTATIENTSAYNASLTSIKASGAPTCTSATATNTTAICNSVTETVQIGSAANQMIVNKDTTTNQTISSGLNLTVNKTNGTAVVTVIIAYDTAAGTPDGDITVTLPTITHDYTTIAG